MTLNSVLQVIEGAYRCNVEEQDDPAIWITHAMKGAGANLHVLLRGNAVGYAIKKQDASGLSFGGRAHKHSPAIEEDLAKLIAKGSEVYFVQDDAAERGLEKSDFISGVKPIARSAIPGLFAQHDQIWQW